MVISLLEMGQNQVHIVENKTKKHVVQDREVTSFKYSKSKKMTSLSCLNLF